MVLLISAQTPAQARLDSKKLDVSIHKIEKQLKGTLGVGVLEIATGDSWYLHGDREFLMQSVAKVPIAIAVLQLVDQQKLSLDKTVPVTGAEVKAIRSGAIPDNLPLKTRGCTLRSLLERSICKSNNGAADVLIRLVGGPAAVSQLFQLNHINGISIDRYQNDIIQPGADTKGIDCCTPRAICQMLLLLSQGKLLQPDCNNVLVNLMNHTSTGEHRIRAGFPSDYAVAHKTGTGRTVAGVAVATNDVALVTGPGGEKLALAVFLADARGSEPARDRTIESVARAVLETWDK